MAFNELGMHRKRMHEEEWWGGKAKDRSGDDIIKGSVCHEIH